MCLAKKSDFIINILRQNKIKILFFRLWQILYLIGKQVYKLILLSK